MPRLADEEEIVEDDQLERVEQKIQELKDPRKKADRQFTRGVALVTSLGFVVVGCILGGYLLGDYLAKRLGSELYLILSLLGGFGMAGYAGYRLLMPFLEDENDGS